MIQPKYFLDPVCGYGNMSERYIKDRLPEIINEFNSKEDAIKYICENEIYLFNYINYVDTLEAKFLFRKHNAVNNHVYFIDWKEDRKNVKDYFKLIEQKLIEENFKNIDENGMPKFDYIIQNPPYKGSLHLSFLEEGLNMLSKTGKMVIIEPSTWLINLRTNGKAKSIYIPLKQKLEGHVKSVVIENLNNEFKINLYVPISITTIDFNKYYNEIDFYNCGEHKIVKSIFDCNLIGNYNLIQSILNKCLSYKDMMKNHIYNDVKNKNKDNWFIKIPDIIGGSGSSLCAIFDTGRNKKNITKLNCNNLFNNINIFNDLYLKPYLHTLFANDAKVQSVIPEKKDLGNKYIPGSIANCVFGTKSEMENYDYYVHNNSLPLFISLCMTIDQHNNVLNYIPWLVDKQRTNEEIYSLLDFTKEEIELIENTLIKYQKDSNWFGRYLCGKVFDK